MYNSCHPKKEDISTHALMRSSHASSSKYLTSIASYGCRLDAPRAVITGSRSSVEYLDGRRAVGGERELPDLATVVLRAVEEAVVRAADGAPLVLARDVAQVRKEGPRVRVPVEPLQVRVDVGGEAAGVVREASEVVAPASDVRPVDLRVCRVRRAARDRPSERGRAGLQVHLDPLLAVRGCPVLVVLVHVACVQADRHVKRP